MRDSREHGISGTVYERGIFLRCHVIKRLRLAVMYILSFFRVCLVFSAFNVWRTGTVDSLESYTNPVRNAKISCHNLVEFPSEVWKVSLARFSEVFFNWVPVSFLSTHIDSGILLVAAHVSFIR